MKTTLLALLMTVSLACGQEYAKPTALDQDSILRQKLLKDLRAVVVPDSSKRSAINVDGDMRAFKNWAFFRGAKAESGAKDAVLSSNHTAALFLKTGSGEWVIVEYTTKFSEELFAQWVAKYALSEELFTQKPTTH